MVGILAGDIVQSKNVCVKICVRASKKTRLCAITIIVERKMHMAD